MRWYFYSSHLLTLVTYGHILCTLRRNTECYSISINNKLTKYF